MKTLLMVKENLNLDDGKIIIHCINTEDGNPRGGWYRQVGASEGMISRSLNRWHDFWHTKKYQTHKSKIRFDRWRSNDEDLYLKMQKNYEEKYDKETALKLFPNFEKIHHDSVWDFFDYINYDYKNKKISNTDTLILISEKK